MMLDTVTSTIKVVLVEDCPVTRATIRNILSEYDGIDWVDEFDSAETFLSALAYEGLDPDVVLMDLKLPSMPGAEAIRRAREFDDSLKLLVLTLHDHEDDILDALVAGAQGYCLKTYSATKLIDIIRSIHAGEFWLDAQVAPKVTRMFEQIKEMQAKEEMVKANGSATVSPQQGNGTSGNGGEGRPMPDFTEQEFHVLTLLVNGKSNKDMAEALGISINTVKTYLTRIIHKIGVSERVSAAVYAVTAGWVRRDTPFTHQTHLLSYEEIEE